MRGRYVLFLDSDDWWDEDLLQSVADVIEQDEPDIVFLDIGMNGFPWMIGNYRQYTKFLKQYL